MKEGVAEFGKESLMLFLLRHIANNCASQNETNKIV